MAAQRISYRDSKGETRHGWLLSSQINALGARYLVVENDASGVIVHILPQQVIG